MGVYGSEQYDLPDDGNTPLVSINNGAYTYAAPPPAYHTQRTDGKGTANSMVVDEYNIPQQQVSPQIRSMEQRLSDSMPDGGFKSVPEYTKALITGIHKAMEEKGMDPNSSEAQDFFKQNYEHGLAQAPSYIDQGSAKDLVENKMTGDMVDRHGNVVYRAGRQSQPEQAQPNQSMQPFDASLPQMPPLSLAGNSDVSQLPPQQVPPVYNQPLAQVPFKQPELTTSERQRAEAQDVIDNEPIGSPRRKAAQEIVKALDAKDNLKQKAEEAKAEDLSQNVEGDVKDILEGRNTMFNVRQTMGRSNKAAKYMENVRSKVREYDPKFDFVASDAGGKSVSSPYVQKSMAAVNAVLPNIDKITELSKDVDRIGIKGIDEALQKGAVQFGNKKVANFRQARKLLADEIGVALGAGSASDMKLQLGFDVTDPAVSDEVFVSNMGVIKDFLENRKTGLTSLRYKSDQVGEQSNVPSAGTLTPPRAAPAGQMWQHNPKTGEWRLKAK